MPAFAFALIVLGYLGLTAFLVWFSGSLWGLLALLLIPTFKMRWDDKKCSKCKKEIEEK